MFIDKEKAAQSLIIRSREGGVIPILRGGRGKKKKRSKIKLIGQGKKGGRKIPKKEKGQANPLEDESVPGKSLVAHKSEGGGGSIT